MDYFDLKTGHDKLSAFLDEVGRPAGSDEDPVDVVIGLVRDQSDADERMYVLQHLVPELVHQTESSMDDYSAIMMTFLGSILDTSKPLWQTYRDFYAASSASVTAVVTERPEIPLFILDTVLEDAYCYVSDAPDTLRAAIRDRWGPDAADELMSAILEFRDALMKLSGASTGRED